jgi:competence protein ComEC
MSCSAVKILCKRPVIVIFIAYAFALTLLDTFGYFSYRKQSSLCKLELVGSDSTIFVEGKVVSEPQFVKGGKRFVLKTHAVSGIAVNEKVLVNSPPGYSISYGDIINIEGKLKKPFVVAFPLVFDYQKYLARDEIYVVLYASSFEYIKSSPNVVKKFVLMFQRDITKKIDTYFEHPCSDVLKSLVVGDKSTLAHNLKESFSNSGIMHILVVSGLHIGFISAAVLLFLKFVGLSLKKASLMSIPFVFLYVAATGANPPALRSAIMFSCVIFSLCLDREPLVYNSLALSALIILIFEPQQLFTASFQMSYGATIGIICFYRDIFTLFRNVRNIILRFFGGILSTTVSAQLVLMPVCMYYFGKISLVSFIANIIVLPLAGIILYLWIVFYVLTFMFQYAAVLCSSVLSLLLNFILSVALFLGNLQFASVLVAKPTVTQITLFFLFLFCLAWRPDPCVRSARWMGGVATSDSVKNYAALQYFRRSRTDYSGFLLKFAGRLFFANRKLIFFMFILVLVFLYFVFNAVHERNKIFFHVYKTDNMTVLHIKSRSLNKFILYNKSKYYDKYFVSSFKQFMSFSGIKRPDITVVGFNKRRISSDLADFNINTFKSAEVDFFDFYFDGNFISVDVSKKNLYIGNVVLSFKDKASFYYDTKRRILM